MNVVNQSFKNSETITRKIILAIFTLNSSILLFFMLISTSVNNIYNVSVEQIDKNIQDLYTIITSVAGIGIVCVVFLTSIIAILFHLLFKERMDFNLSLRLVGCTGNNLMKIYFKECVSIQKISLVAGTVIGILAFMLFSSYLELEVIYYFNVQVIIISILISALIFSYVSYTVINKLVKFEIVDVLRTDINSVEIKKNKVLKNIFWGFIYVSIVSTWIYFNFLVEGDFQFGNYTMDENIISTLNFVFILLF